MAGKIFWNILGFSLGILGIVMIFLKVGSPWLWLVVGLIGAIVYGGLPSKRMLKSLVKWSPASMIMAVLFTALFIALFGSDKTIQIILASLMGAFFIQKFFLDKMEKVVK